MAFDETDDLEVTIAPAGSSNTVAGLPAVRIIITIIGTRPPRLVEEYA
jgi:hypothetical protein